MVVKPTQWFMTLFWPFIALLNGMIKVILDNGWENREFIAKRTEGFEEFRQKVSEYDLDRVGDITGVAKEKRIPMRKISPSERKGNFKEIALGFTEEEVRKEAERCLKCGICSECYQCVDACIAGAIDHEMKSAEEEIEVGSIIAAPGFEVFDPHDYERFAAQYLRLTESTSGWAIPDFCKPGLETVRGLRHRHYQPTLVRVEEAETERQMRAMQYLQKTGRITNFDKAAGKFDGPLKGHHAFDSDLHKALSSRQTQSERKGADSSGPRRALPVERVTPVNWMPRLPWNPPFRWTKVTPDSSFAAQQVSTTSETSLSADSFSPTFWPVVQNPQFIGGS